MTTWIQNDWYWHEDEREGWRPLQLLTHDGNIVTLRTQQDEHVELPASTQLVAALPSSLTPVQDMVELSQLHEGAILNNLRQRYAKDEVYTNISSILISINPYKLLPCYGPAVMRMYRNALATRNTVRPPKPTSASESSSSSSSSANSSSPAASQALPPHIYALSDDAYTSLVRDEQNQAIIISGESGAGKTEAAKLVLQYLAECSGGGSSSSRYGIRSGASTGTGTAGSSMHAGVVAQQVLEANPILESFGNAKTVRNNNSSRFGKFQTIEFDSKTGKMRGATCQAYLLEKSRVVNHAHGERSYHSFYQLCAGAAEEERAALHLSEHGAAAYRILTHGDCLSVDGMNDAQEYRSMRHALTALNFSEEECATIMRVLAAILHLGNCLFEAEGSTSTASGTQGTTKGDERFEIVNASTSLNYACELLSIDPTLCATRLTTRRLRVGSETITKYNPLSACEEQRDTLCKTLYERLFMSLLLRINRTLHSPHEDGGSTPRIIGLLDIFGFENFEATGNHFSQLMINFANEKLQQHFIRVVFRLEQSMYESEVIDVSTVDYTDNQCVLDLIEARDFGIIDQIKEETRLPKGSDLNLLQRMHDMYAPKNAAPASSRGGGGKALPRGSEYYIKPKVKDPCFIVRHYAGDVTYRIEGTVKTNKDHVSDDLRACIESSTDPLVAQIMQSLKEMEIYRQQQLMLQQGHAHLDAVTIADTPTATPHSPNSALRGRRIRSPSEANIMNPASSSVLSTSAPVSSFVPSIPLSTPQLHRTLGVQFRSQLSSLISTLSSCRANFIRCLKPNAEKIADEFDAHFVLKQLQYLGLKDVIAIRQKGFPVRLKHRDFWKRYRMLLTTNLKDQSEAVDQDARNDVKYHECIRAIFRHVGVSDDDWRLGLTQVFCRSNLHTTMETARDAKLVEAVVKLQAVWRKAVAMRRAIKLKLAASRLASATQAVRDTLYDADRSISALEELDAALTDATDLELPTRHLEEAAHMKQRCMDVQQSRRALAAALQCKDITLLHRAIERASSIGLPASSSELASATSLVSRLQSYELMARDALASGQLNLLENAQNEAKQLGLDSAQVREIDALVARIRAETECVERMEKLLQERGPLADLQAAISAAEDAGLSAIASAVPVLQRAHQLKDMLVRENELLASLNAALASRELSALEAALKALSTLDPSSPLHSDPHITAARTLRRSLKAQAKASELAEALRAACRSNNVALIESGLTNLQDLDVESMMALGEEGANLVDEANALLVTLRARAAVLATLQKAAEARSLQSLTSALAEAEHHDIGKDHPVYAAALDVHEHLMHAIAQLEAATSGDDLVALESALENAPKAGLSSSSSPVFSRALAKRAILLKRADCQTLLRAATEAADEAMLIHALQKAEEAQLDPNDETLLAANQTLARMRRKDTVARATDVQEREAAVVALKQEQARQAAMSKSISSSARAKAAVAPAAVAATSSAAVAAAASIPSPSASSPSPSSSPSSSSPGKVSRGSTFLSTLDLSIYRSCHFALYLFPTLYTPDEYARGKLIGKAALKKGMLRWSKDSLPRSLTRLPEELSSVACTLFKGIQAFMLDRVYSFPDGCAVEVLTQGLEHEELRDEIYVQLAKQLTANPNEESVRRGWVLMGLACETFGPSSTLRPFLLNFLLQFYDQPDYPAANYVHFCQRSVMSMPAGVTIKSHSPSIDAVAAFRERVMASAEVRIHMPDGSFIDTFVHANMNVAEVCEEIMVKLGMGGGREGYGIMHVGAHPDFLPIPLGACLLDYPAASTPVGAGHGPGSSGCSLVPRFLFHKRSWFGRDLGAELPSLPSDKIEAIMHAAKNDPTAAAALATTATHHLSRQDRITLNMLYAQWGLEVLQLERYAMDREEKVQLQAGFNKANESRAIPLLAQDPSPAASILADLHPSSSQLAPGESDAFDEEVGAHQLTLIHSSPVCCPLLTLLSFMHRTPHWGYVGFEVRNEELKVLPPTVIIGFAVTGIYLIHPDTKCVLKGYEYRFVTGWGANAVRFSMRVAIARLPDGRIKTQPLNFKTKHGDKMQTFLDETVRFIERHKKLPRKEGQGQ